MTIQANIHEAKTNLSRLLDRVMTGEAIIIAKAGKPIARLSPLTEPLLPRAPGNDAGKVIMAANFDDPLPEFEDTPR